MPTDYPQLSQMGFTAVQGSATQNSTVLKTSLAAAGKAKLVVDMPLYIGGRVGGDKLRDSLQELSFCAKEQGIIDWKFADEPDQHPESMDDIPVVYQRLKQDDPQRALLLTVEDPATYEYWANFCDALQVVCFPLPDKPLTLISDRVSRARSALQPWQHLSVVLQAGWLPGNANQPSFDQARAMVYLAIINGAQGISWYALNDPGFKLTDSPLWGKFDQLNQETARLGGIALNGQPAQLQNDNPKLQAAAWAEGKGFDLMMVNPEATAQTATFKLPQAATKAEIAKGKGIVEVKDGALAVTIEAGQAALVTISTGAGAPTPPVAPPTPAAPTNPGPKPAPPTPPAAHAK
jgi:hypothetical protein